MRPSYCSIRPTMKKYHGWGDLVQTCLPRGSEGYKFLSSDQDSFPGSLLNPHVTFHQHMQTCRDRGRHRGDREEPGDKGHSREPALEDLLLQGDPNYFRRVPVPKSSSLGRGRLDILAVFCVQPGLEASVWITSFPTWLVFHHLL